MPVDDVTCRQLAPHPVERGADRAVLEPRDRRLGRQGPAGHRVPPEQQLVDGVVGQVVGIVAIALVSHKSQGQASASCGRARSGGEWVVKRYFERPAFEDVELQHLEHLVELLQHSRRMNLR